jgi:hypothetical protein
MSNGRKKCKVCGSWTDGQCCATIDLPPVQRVIKQEAILKEVLDENQALLSRLSKEDTGAGLKYDAGKPDLSLVPVEALNSIALCFEYGARKYEHEMVSCPGCLTPPRLCLRFWSKV